MITTYDKLIELSACYTLAEIINSLDITEDQLQQLSPTNIPPELEQKINIYFDKHCITNSQLVDIDKLSEYSDDLLLLVDTPDGYQPIIRFHDKGLRTIHVLSTTNATGKFSNDHLIETPSGWIFVSDLIVGDLVITRFGVEQIVSNVIESPQLVYDFEVSHINQRYWANDFSSHNSGKSYISANLVVAAQQAGAYCLVIDSENALDDDFMTKIGVNVNENYKYVSVSTIPQVTKIVSSFLKGYQSSIGEAEDGPQVMILIDSLDMLMTDTERDNFNKGVTKGDQGQKNKQLKAMLRSFVQAIKELNVAMVCTSQVYKNQDVLNGEGVWIVADAVKYACSQIILIQKRKLKDESKDAKLGDFSGVRMICEGYKTRFTMPFQKVEIEVPYETGMDPLSGLKEVATKAGVLIKRGSYLQLAGTDHKFYERDMEPFLPQILTALEALDRNFMDVDPEIIANTDE